MAEERIEDSELDAVATDDGDEGIYGDIGEQTPAMNTPEWHAYVMSQFVEDELMDGSPTLDGLRRVTELLIGEIVSSTVSVHQTPNTENSSRATVSVEVVLESDNRTYVYSDVADVYHGNTDTPYSKHPVATASSRAEARAFRKALRLRKVISAEEMSVAAEKEDVPQEEWAPAVVSAAQLALLSKAGERNNVNLKAFINQGQTQYDNPKDIPFVVAKKMIEEINKYNDGTSVPKALQGYDSNWRK